jgi:site-specific DNA-methyltransferase (adenine-specific)
MNMDYERIGNQLCYYHSSENMKELSDQSIDVIITSPPYNRGKQYSDDLGNTFNDKQHIDHYRDLLHSVFQECYRVLKNSGIFFLNIGDSANDQGKSELVVRVATKSGFIRLQTIIWIKSFLGKGHYTPSGGDKRLNNIWEHIYVLVKNKKEYKLYPKDIGVPYSDKSNIGRYNEADLRDAGNVWFIPYSKTTGKTTKKGHDAPFPVELAIKCIKLTRAENVLDPFLGTGSTLAAAEICGIAGFGYEKYPRKELIRNKIRYVDRTLLNNLNFLQITELEQAIDYLAELIDRYNNKISLKEIIKETKKERVSLDITKKVLLVRRLKKSFLEDLNQPNKKTGKIKDHLK